MMKKLSAALAALTLAAALAGCTIRTPQSVGTIGDVDIPAGIYLLEQYNAYQAAKNLTSDTDVLNATLKLDDGTEQKGSDYVAAQTLKNLEYYAAVETKFAELGGEMSADDLSSAKTQADSLWKNYGDSLQKNGIGQTTAETYAENSVKSTKLVSMIYGPDGTSPVSDEDLWSYMDANFSVGEYIVLPLIDYSTYAALDDDKKAQVTDYANQMKTAMEGGASATDAAKQFLPQVLSLLGQTYSDDSLSSYVGSTLYTPSSSSTYGEQISTGMLATKAGQVSVISSDSMLMVYSAKDLHTTYTLDQLRDGALVEMKGEELDTMYADLGKSLNHNLSDSAMKTYSAKKIQQVKTTS